jgi:hypothetical protein
VKTQTQEKHALFIAKDGAGDILEPLVDALLANGLTAAEIQGAVTASAERALRISLTDSGLPVSLKSGVKLRTTTVKAEAQLVAKKLFERLTVKNADHVPPVSKRRGLPAAVAAA